EHLDALGMLEVERDRALVAVQVLEVELVAREVVLLARLHLDDLGAHLGELTDAGGAGPRAGEVDDAVGLEWKAHGGNAITAARGGAGPRLRYSGAGRARRAGRRPAGSCRARSA